jgi:hypothetical protein
MFFIKFVELFGIIGRNVIARGNGSTNRIMQVPKPQEPTQINDRHNKFGIALANKS